MTKIGKKNVEQSTPEYLAVRAANIEKSSGGSLGYEVGKHVVTGEPGLHIVSNSSSGTFSKEWVSFAAIRRALAGAAERFPASTLATAINAKGKNNAFFIAAALVGEGLLARHPEGGLNLAGDWQAWGDAVRALPLPEIAAPPSKEAAAIGAATGETSTSSTASTAPGKRAGKKAKGGAPPSVQSDAPPAESAPPRRIRPTRGGAGGARGRILMLPVARG
jgi:hypothetical protein